MHVQSSIMSSSPSQLRGSQGTHTGIRQPRGIGKGGSEPQVNTPQLNMSSISIVCMIQDRKITNSMHNIYYYIFDGLLSGSPSSISSFRTRSYPVFGRDSICLIHV